MSTPSKKGRKREAERMKRLLEDTDVSPSMSSVASAANHFGVLDHDYVEYVESGSRSPDQFIMSSEDFPTIPITPSKSPARKKSSNEVPASNSDVIATLSALINTRSNAIEKMVAENLQRIQTMAKRIEAVCADLKDTKERVSKLERRVATVDEPMRLMQRRLDELETNHRRVNLKLYGVPETAKQDRDREDVRRATVKICQAVLPAMSAALAGTIDVVHRLGKIRQTDNNRPRPIILRFISRDLRDALWRAAKTSTYLKEQRLHFREDFSKGDAERRVQLWPALKKARDAGKIAYYVGGRAFIEGEGEIMLPAT